MAFRSKRVRRLVLRVLPVTVALVVLLVSLILVSNVQQDASGVSQPYVWVLVLTVFALLVVTVAIFHRVITLTKKVREHAPGAMLSARWVRYFLVLSLPPALIVYFFSAYFLTRTVDSWFDVGVEAALAIHWNWASSFWKTARWKFVTRCVAWSGKLMTPKTMLKRYVLLYWQMSVPPGHWSCQLWKAMAG